MKGGISNHKETIVFLINDTGTTDEIRLIFYTLYLNKLQKDLRSKHKKQKTYKCYRKTWVNYFLARV